MSTYIIGIDTGGTFTDIVVVDDNGTVITGKALSTPPNFSNGVMDALRVLAEKMGINTGDLLEHTAICGFGTTVATNALWTRTGARTGLLMTMGFEETHHIARGISKWAGLPEAQIKHQAMIRKPMPLAPRDMAMGVVERVDYDGRVLCPLNTNQLKQAARTLADKGAESIAICFLWSVRNSIHELEAKRIVRELLPDVYVTASVEVSPTLGEYERANTAIVDGYVGPVTVKFLDELTRKFKNSGFKHELLIMKADGGTAFARELLPVATVHSGPAGGVIGAKYFGDLMGWSNIITTDVGGTSLDVSIIREGNVIYSREPTLEKFSVSYPSIDVKSIGAGGGSIIATDPTFKLFTVGPKSAGASPGPACYGLGGVEPTITDACLVLGYLNPDYFLGGRMKLYPDKAHEALKRVADQLGLDIVELAAGAYDIMNAHCTGLIRALSIERGYDPRDFVLFSFGGAGPLFAATWGKELGAKGMVMCREAAVYSALGIATADVVHMRVLFDHNRLPMDANKFNRDFETLEAEIKRYFDREEIDESDRILNRFVEMKYGAQYHVIRVPIEHKKYDAEDISFLETKFDTVFEDIYGKGSAYTKSGREVISFVIQGIGRITKPRLSKRDMRGSDPSAVLKGMRNAYFRKYKRFVTTNIYDYDKLQAGNIVNGPAIIEAEDTTILIPPDQKGEVDAYMNIIVR